MTDRPIIFSAPMVRALLDGRKTMTRRLAWSSRKPSQSNRIQYSCRWDGSTPWQKVKPGDRLWVREAFSESMPSWAYMADFTGDPRGLGWRPSIHMPRRASRLTLVVTATKIEKLLEISERDAVNEGVYCARESNLDDRAPSALFFALWESLHGPASFRANPDVVALTFTVHQANIDAP